MVFHAPQESHLPCQRPNTAPQFWQMKLGAWRDMGYGQKGSGWGSLRDYHRRSRDRKTSQSLFNANIGLSESDIHPE
jgi:hypothetical protein